MYGNTITFFSWGIAVLSALAVAFWPFSLYLSVFMFDAPGATERALNWLSVLLLLSYPASVYVGIGIAKKAHENTQSLRAVFGLVVCYSNFILLFILLKWFI